MDAAVRKPQKRQKEFERRLDIELLCLSVSGDKDHKKWSQPISKGWAFRVVDGALINLRWAHARITEAINTVS
jgi:alkyl hydroperoxide reductase subunit AhpC